MCQKSGGFTHRTFPGRRSESTSPSKSSPTGTTRPRFDFNYGTSPARQASNESLIRTAHFYFLYWKRPLTLTKQILRLRYVRMGVQQRTRTFTTKERFGNMTRQVLPYEYFGRDFREIPFCPSYAIPQKRTLFTFISMPPEEITIHKVCPRAE